MAERTFRPVSAVLPEHTYQRLRTYAEDSGLKMRVIHVRALVEFLDKYEDALERDEQTGG